MKKCPNCSHNNPLEFKFCSNCGTQFSQPQQTTITTTPVCSKCNSKNPSGTHYCIFCGQPIPQVPQQKVENELAAYWYCSSDQELMKETSQDHQFPLSINIEESVTELINKGKIKPEQASLATEIAKKVFQARPDMKFPVLTRVRCPICLRDTLAPVTFQPLSTLPSNTPSYLSTDVPYIPYTSPKYFPDIYRERSSILAWIRNGYDLILQNPQFLIIPMIIILMEVLVNSFGIRLYDSSSLLSMLWSGFLQEEFLSNSIEFTIGILADMIIETVFITLVLVAFTYTKNYDKPLTLSSDYIPTQTSYFFPRILGAKLFFDGVFSLEFIVYNLVAQSFSTTMDYVGLFLSMFVSIISLVFIFFPLIFLRYLYPIIVLEKRGVLKSIFGSIKFARHFLSITILILIVFFILPLMLLSLAPLELWELGIIDLIYRLIDTFQIITVTVGFDKFKSTIDF